MKSSKRLKHHKCPFDFQYKTFLQDWCASIVTVIGESEAVERISHNIFKFLSELVCQQMMKSRHGLEGFISFSELGLRRSDVCP